MRGKRKAQNRGITLMALVITIIVMLILAAISLNAMFGKYDTIETSISTKDSAEIKSEIEIIQISAKMAKDQNKYGDLKQEDLEAMLASNTENKDVNVQLYDNNIFIIEFVESKRTYKIDADDNQAEFIGNSDNLLNIGVLIAKPKSARTPQEKREITLTLKSLTEINASTTCKLQYVWKKTNESEPTEEEYNNDTAGENITETTSNTERTRIIETPDEHDEYYLWARGKIGDGEIIAKRFGPYIVGRDILTNDEYQLEINPNGGIFYGNTESENQYIVTGKEGDTYDLGTMADINGYKVTFDSKGGSAQSTITSKKSFNGWSVSGKGSLFATTYTFGKGDGKVTAQWKDEEITLPTPTRTGYTFDGWYEDEEYTTKAQDENKAEGKYTPKKNITLYAKWEAQT